MPNWWLVSWTTYATWLPGDKRGFCTWRKREYIPPPTRYAQPGEATYHAADFKHVRELAEEISEEPVYFTADQMQIALAAIVAEVAEISIVPAIISLGSWHVHWLCHFGTLRIRPTVGRVKAAATRELNAFGFQGKTPVDQRVQHAFKAHAAGMSRRIQVRAQPQGTRLFSLRMAN